MGSDHPRLPPRSASSTLALLYDSSHAGVPYVTYSFLALCCVITLPTLAFPSLYGYLGGAAPWRFPWQPFTAVLEHGWPGFPGSVHLALNAFLMLECGRPCERLLGSGPFLILGIASVMANAVAQYLAGGVNGSSLVIWAWGPPLFVALRWAKRRDPRATGSPAYGRIRAVLVVMYVAIVVAMGLLPYLAGWRGNPLQALLTGNLFHLVATGVGVAYVGLAAGSIRRRLSSLVAAGD